MKNLKIDENAHTILTSVREQIKDSGIENPNLSDAIRELDHRAKGSFVSLPGRERSRKPSRDAEENNEENI